MGISSILAPFEGGRASSLSPFICHHSSDSTSSLTTARLEPMTALTYHHLTLSVIEYRSNLTILLVLSSDMPVGRWEFHSGSEMEEYVVFLKNELYNQQVIVQLTAGQTDTHRINDPLDYCLISENRLGGISADLNGSMKWSWCDSLLCEGWEWRYNLNT